MEWIPTEPFFHSFSATGVSKVLYVSNGNDRGNETLWDDKDYWLPQANINAKLTAAPIEKTGTTVPLVDTSLRKCILSFKMSLIR